MTPEFDEVLLTAYLDDEVTDAERTAVQEQLQKSEAARKLLEELRSIRNMVTQLHLSQPNRNLQNGEWNAMCESAPVTLRAAESSKQWRLTIQRLASIAAIVAIVACTTVLLLEPYRKGISRANAPSVQPSDQSSAKSKERIESAETAPKEAESEISQQSTSDSSDPFRFDSKASEDLLFRQSEVQLKLKKEAGKEVEPVLKSERGPVRGETPLQDASQSPQIALAPGSRNGLGSPPGASLSRSASRKYEETEGKLQNERDSMNMLSLEKQKRSEEPIELDLSLSRFFDSYFQEGDLQKSNMLAVDDFVRTGAFPDENTVNSETLVTNETIFRFTWNDQKMDQAGKQVADSKEGKSRLPESDASDREISLFSKEDSKRSLSLSMKKVTGDRKPLLIEFEIPSEEWGAGANRLRQLGIEVPLELPKAEVLEFVAKDNENAVSDVTTALVKDAAEGVLFQEKEAKEAFSFSPSSGKTASLGRGIVHFQQIAPASANGQDDKTSKIRIRVRVKKQP